MQSPAPATETRNRNPQPKQVRGHYLSHLDPLEINSANIHMEHDGPMPKFLDHKTYGFSDEDLDRECRVPPRSV